jgi:histidine phosphotransfer protein HptB
MADLGWNREFALEQAGEDEELLAELLNLLCSSSIDDLARIKRGMASGDVEAASQAAHSIKGAAASMGMEGLSLLAHEIEQAGMAGDFAMIFSSLGDLEEMVLQLESLR